MPAALLICAALFAVAAPAGASGNASIDALILKNPVPGWTDPQYGPTAGASGTYQATELFTPPSKAATLRITIMDDPGYPFPRPIDLATLWCGQGAVIVSQGSYAVIPDSLLVTCHPSNASTPVDVMVWQNGNYLPEVELAPATSLPLSQFDSIAVRQAAAIPTGSGSNALLIAVGCVAAAALLVVLGVMLLRRRALYPGSVGAPSGGGPAEQAGQPNGPPGGPGDDPGAENPGVPPPPIPVRDDWMPKRELEEASTSPDPSTAAALPAPTEGNGTYGVAPAASHSSGSNGEAGDSLPPFQKDAPVKPAVVHVPDPELARMPEVAVDPLGEPLPAFRADDEPTAVPGLMPTLANPANLPAVNLAPEAVIGEIIPPPMHAPLPVPAMAAPALGVPAMAASPVELPQLAAPQMPVPQMPVPQMPVPQMPVPQMPVPQMPVPQMPVPQMPAAEMPGPPMVMPVMPAPVAAPPMAAPAMAGVPVAAPMAAPPMAAPAMAGVPVAAPMVQPVNGVAPMALPSMPGAPTEVAPSYAVPMAVPATAPPAMAVAPAVVTAMTAPPMPEMVAPPVAAAPMPEPMAAAPMPLPQTPPPTVQASVMPPVMVPPAGLPLPALPMPDAGGAAVPGASMPLPVELPVMAPAATMAVPPFPVLPEGGNGAAMAVPVVEGPLTPAPVPVPTPAAPVVAAPTEPLAAESPAVPPLPPFQLSPAPVAAVPEPLVAQPALAPLPVAWSPVPAPAAEPLPVGWHPDPSDANGGAVYWDGSRWTARRFWDGSAWVDAPF